MLDTNVVPSALCGAAPRIGCTRRFDSAQTQVEMAATLGVSQQTINSYEVGRRRIPVSALPPLARSLGVSLEKLLGDDDAAAAKKRGPAPKLQQQIERIQHLPRTKQKFVMEMIDTVLAQQSR